MKFYLQKFVSYLGKISPVVLMLLLLCSLNASLLKTMVLNDFGNDKGETDPLQVIDSKKESNKRIDKLDLSAQEQFLISLGNRCECAHQAGRCGLSREYLPFNWMFSKNFDVVHSLIENNFQDFMELKNLKIDSLRSKNNKFNKHFVVNKKLAGISFNHDFPNNKKLVDVFAEVHDKYIRRINRFYKVLDSGKPVYFMRIGITKKQAKKFCDMMKTKFPKLTFYLIALNDHRKVECAWNLPRVYHFDRSSETDETSLGKDDHWDNTFKELGFI